jgi:predicted nucleotidyltransferase
MKNLLKNLPTKKNLKEFFSIDDSKRFTVTKIHYSKQCIMLDCKIKEGFILIPSFYMQVSFLDFKKSTFTIIILNEFYPHIIKNVKTLLPYLRTLKNTKP